MQNTPCFNEHISGIYVQKEQNIPPEAAVSENYKGKQADQPGAGAKC